MGARRHINDAEENLRNAVFDYFSSCDKRKWIFECYGNPKEFDKYEKIFLDGTNPLRNGAGHEELRRLIGTSDITCDGDEYCYTVIGYENLNAWHHVSIRHVAQNDYAWVNSAGVKWSLRECGEFNGSVYCIVGNDCPYPELRNTTALFTHRGVYGPANEFYEKKASRQL